jgi:hypothetical protein
VREALLSAYPHTIHLWDDSNRDWELQAKGDLRAAALFLVSPMQRQGEHHLFVDALLGAGHRRKGRYGALPKHDSTLERRTDAGRWVHRQRWRRCAG